MNKIEKLIQELCPEGVKIRLLGELEDAGILKLGRGNVISKTDLAATPGDYPVYSSSAAGEGEFGRYGKFMFDDERITWSVDGGGRFFYRPPHKYSVTNVSGWIKVHDPNVLSTKYLAHVLFHLWATKTYNYTVKAHPSVIRQDYSIPVPPLEVQKEIASILDNFTEVQAELEAELEARRKQYVQYRNKLLSTHLPTDVEFKTLRELLGPITRGKRLTKSNLAKVGSIPVFHGGLNPIGYHDKSNTPGETVMVINTGASSGSVGWSITPFWCSDGCFALPHSKEFSSRYIYHYASLNEQFFMDKVRKAGIPTLASESIYSLRIPVLPMTKQLEITRILDAFLELTSNQSIGVPAEIQARQKQYEYYRNKLLTFKELDAA